MSAGHIDPDTGRMIVRPAHVLLPTGAYWLEPGPGRTRVLMVAPVSTHSAVVWDDATEVDVDAAVEATMSGADGVPDYAAILSALGEDLST
jgi:hypothetical protein